MGGVKTIFALFLALLAALPVAAREWPVIIHGDATVMPGAFGAVYEVMSDRVQVRLSSALVATAAKGTAFEVYPPLLGGSSEILHVTRGAVSIIDERHDRGATLAANGRFSYDAPARASSPEAVIDVAGSVQGQAIAAPVALENAYSQWQLQEARQGFLLSDSVMTRQQEYLSSLKIDITDLNRVLASFIRRLLF